VGQSLHPIGRFALLGGSFVLSRSLVPLLSPTARGFAVPTHNDSLIYTQREQRAKGAGGRRGTGPREKGNAGPPNVLRQTREKRLRTPLTALGKKKTAVLPVMQRTWLPVGLMRVGTLSLSHRPSNLVPGPPTRGLGHQPGPPGGFPSTQKCQPVRVVAPPQGLPGFQGHYWLLRSRSCLVEELVRSRAPWPTASTDHARGSPCRRPRSDQSEWRGG
jgi:hypothetical protein